MALAIGVAMGIASHARSALLGRGGQVRVQQGQGPEEVAFPPTRSLSPSVQGPIESPVVATAPDYAGPHARSGQLRTGSAAGQGNPLVPRAARLEGALTGVDCCPDAACLVSFLCERHEPHRAMNFEHLFEYPAAVGTWHDPELGRPIAAPLERCAELLGVDLATVRELAATVEPYVRADGIKIWSLMLLERQLRPGARPAVVIVEPLLPTPPRPRTGAGAGPSRIATCFAAIVFMAPTSTPWRLLPARELGCGSPATCWRRLSRL